MTVTTDQPFEEIEIGLLLEALYQRYHYDFRLYAQAPYAADCGKQKTDWDSAPSRRSRTHFCTMPRCCLDCWTT
jgi:hypothetical protein